MDNQLNNGFCPKCGALLRDGVCPSCGFGKETPDESMNPYNTGNGYDSSNGDAGAAAQSTENMQQNQYSQNYYNQSDDNQNQYNQSGYNQNGYDQNQYGQNGYNQGQYTQNGYGQNQYNQNQYNNQNGNYQNQYYQNMQGGYYQQNGNGYYGQPPKKSGSGGVVAIIIGGIILLLLVVIGVAFGLVSAVNKANERQADDDLYNYDDDYDYDYNYDYDDDYDSYGQDDDYDDYDDLMDFVDDIDWDDDEYWKIEPYNYDPEDVGTDYYYELCNCIDESVSYDIVHENYEELERENNVCIRINYYQLEGDIPNLTAINEALKDQAMWAGELYHDEKDEFEYEFERYGAGYVAEVESYVTYNDEQTISVVSDIYYESATSVRRVVDCTNIDIETGTVLKNTDILDVSDEFISDYRKITEDQNGLIPALEYFDDDELREFLELEDCLIAYYTPCGLEIGINYETDEKYGWFSATLTDYEQYLKSY